MRRARNGLATDAVEARETGDASRSHAVVTIVADALGDIRGVFGAVGVERTISDLAALANLINITIHTHRGSSGRLLTIRADGDVVSAGAVVIDVTDRARRPSKGRIDIAVKAWHAVTIALKHRSIRGLGMLRARENMLPRAPEVGEAGLATKD